MMKLHAALALSISIAALAALAGCSSSDGAGDAGVTADAGIGSDASSGTDAVPGLDATDARPSSDAAEPDAAEPTSDAGGSRADAGGAPDASASVSPSELTTIAAGAVCGALFRCCNTSDVEAYFAPYASSELLASFRTRIPPAATLDETSCRSVLKEMMDIVPFGDWVREAEAGHVGFEPLAVAACVAALETNTCGEGARSALSDSGCFAFAAPAGGTEQRRMFTRTRGAGQTCAPIRDGVGASFYGTCDPTTSFCCYQNPSSPNSCSFPFGQGGVARSGTCAAAGAPGEACSSSLPLHLCQTGLDCDSDTAECRAPVTTPLSAGATCVDASFNLLGECTNSWCDVLGSKLCEPLKTDGTSCSAAYECASGDCPSGQCAAPTACSGP